jgi:hypothetical protein
LFISLKQVSCEEAKHQQLFCNLSLLASTVTIQKLQLQNKSDYITIFKSIIFASLLRILSPKFDAVVADEP